MLVSDFERIREITPDLEEKIFSVKGLMTDLLSQKKRKFKSRKSS